MVRWLQLDLRSPKFRLPHHRHNLLTGEVGKFTESSIKLPKQIDFIPVNCLVEVQSLAYLYIGKLESFYFNRAGELDLLVLSLPVRLTLGAEDDLEPYPINAQFLYLMYEEIKNISILYGTIRPDVAAIQPA